MTLGVQHGGQELPSVTVDAYNAELRDNEGFVGDRASNRAFRNILDDLRELFPDDADPLGDAPTQEISKQRMDKILFEGEPEAGGVMIGAIETWAQEFAKVIRRFLRLPGWKGTERIVVGGGLRGCRVGELAIGRTTSLLRGEGIGLQLQPIRHHPDEAGLIGAAHLAPSWIFAGHDSILAVDIGGTNMRAGLVKLNQRQASDLSQAEVVVSDLWHHRADKPTREEAVQRLCAMLSKLVDRAAADKLVLAPFVGLGCPGLITEDGRISRGGQNLPGNWEEENFNLPEQLTDRLPKIDGHQPTVLMHNDAVVQGLSEVPFMQDVTRWGVMTAGTGLGNARFTNTSGSEAAETTA